MNHGYIDTNLVQNSSLACFILTTFVKRYEINSARTKKPELMKLLLVLPIVWHEDSCNAIKSRFLSTPLQAVLAECPEIKYEFEKRLGAFSPIALQGINLACASGLLQTVYENETPYLSTNFDRWPQGSKPNEMPSEMIAAIERLSVWFREKTTAQLYSCLIEG